MEDEQHFEQLHNKLEEATHYLDKLMNILMDSWTHQPCSEFMKKMHFIFEEFPEANLSCAVDPGSGFQANINPDHPRFNRVVRFEQDGEFLGYFIVRLEKEPIDPRKKRRYLAIRGTHSHSIPVHSRATAIVNKTVEFRFRSILKTLIEAKYHEHPQTKDNIHQCKIMIGELEKMLFKMT